MVVVVGIWFPAKIVIIPKYDIQIGIDIVFKTLITVFRAKLTWIRSLVWPS